MTAKATERKMLTAEAIASAHDRSDMLLDIPEWSGTVRIRALSYDLLSVAREKAWDKLKHQTNEDLLNAWCIALGMVEPAIDFEIAKSWIMDRSFGPVNTILSAILASSGLGSRAQAEAKSEAAG